MTGAELKAARKGKLKIQQKQLAAMIDTPLRTYQDWENEVNPVPGHMAVLMGLLIERDERITQEIIDRLKNRITRSTACTTFS